MKWKKEEGEGQFTEAAGAPGTSAEGGAAPVRVNGRGSSNRNQKILLGTCAVILALILLLSALFLGYCIGSQHSTLRGLAAGGQGGQLLQRLRQGLGGQQGQQNGRLKQLQKLLQSGEAQIVRGSVTGVQDGKATIETAQGSQTVSLTDKTRYLKAGAGVQSGAGGVAPGQQVVVLVRKGASGLEAVVVRITRAGKASGGGSPGSTPAAAV